jgi:hypothetical protein
MTRGTNADDYVDVYEEPDHHFQITNRYGDDPQRSG